jgi:coenzyme PQQ precursor peptide PqqA
MRLFCLIVASMKWITPDFEEIALSMEVTAYVNVGD